MKKALIVTYEPFEDHTHSLDRLNTCLENGWDVVLVTPMGGISGGDRWKPRGACLVIIEKAENDG